MKMFNLEKERELKEFTKDLPDLIKKANSQNSVSKVLQGTEKGIKKIENL